VEKKDEQSFFVITNTNSLFKFLFPICLDFFFSTFKSSGLANRFKTSQRAVRISNDLKITSIVMINFLFNPWPNETNE